MYPRAAVPGRDWCAEAGADAACTPRACTCREEGGRVGPSAMKKGAQIAGAAGRPPRSTGAEDQPMTRPPAAPAAGVLLSQHGAQVLAGRRRTRFVVALPACVASALRSKTCSSTSSLLEEGGNFLRVFALHLAARVGVRDRALAGRPCIVQCAIK